MSEYIYYKSFNVKENEAWYGISFIINGNVHYLDLNEPNFTNFINLKEFKNATYNKSPFTYRCNVDDKTDMDGYGYIDITIKNDILTISTVRAKILIKSTIKITDKNNKKIVWMLSSILKNIYILLDATMNYWIVTQCIDNFPRRNIEEIRSRLTVPK